MLALSRSPYFLGKSLDATHLRAETLTQCRDQQRRPLVLGSSYRSYDDFEAKKPNTIPITASAATIQAATESWSFVKTTMIATMATEMPPITPAILTKGSLGIEFSSYSFVGRR